MHGHTLDGVDFHVTVSGSRRSGHAWRLWRGTALVASSAGPHPSPEAAELDADQFRRLARSAGYDVLRAGTTWTWRAWHDGMVRAHGPAGFATQEAARAAAHDVRDRAQPLGRG